jgi:glycerol-3-phosphate cytidylyltransferase
VFWITTLKVPNKTIHLIIFLIGDNMRVGFVASAWDLLHAGHVQMLREAKQQCDYLIVGLQTDPTIDRPEKNKPIQTIVERYTQLKGVKYVDEIIPYATEKDLEDVLTMYHIDVRILGEEYREKEFTGKDICRKRGIELFFNKRDHRFSSSDLRNRVVQGIAQ